MAKILEHAEDSPEVWDYLPDKRDIGSCHRQWIINIIYKIGGKPFVEWTQEKMKERDEKLARDRDLVIELDGELAQAFMDSTSISCK